MIIKIRILKDEQRSKEQIEQLQLEYRGGYKQQTINIVSSDNIISIEKILRVKLCGHPNFSPQFYYKQIDRCEKGYIDTQDIVTYIKKSKPTFNVDHRYLKSLFIKLNQDARVPSDRLTYFGYLNIIKPYFQNELARDLLLRDNVAIGVQINLVVKKLLEDLICALYVSVAQHERVKELIIFGDIQQGGRDPGSLYNIYQLLQIIKNGANQHIPSINTIALNIPSAPNIGSNPNIVTNINIPSSSNMQQNNIRGITNQNTNPNIRSQVSISQNVSKKYRDGKQGILGIFYSFINNFSQYQIERQQMKYLLAYLMCHQYMVTQQKYLTMLFMPVCAEVLLPKYKQQQLFIQKQPSSRNQNQIPSGDNNFLTYVHPQSVSKQQIQTERKKQLRYNNMRHQYHNPQIKQIKKQRYPSIQQKQSRQKLIVEQPRILIHPPNQTTIQTPILQRFLRESKVLKNMSRYHSAIREQNTQQQQSAFIRQGQQSRIKYYNDRERQKQQQQQQQYLNPNIGVQHRQKPVNKDFNLQQVLNNSNLHRSQYYNNLSMRAFIKDQPLRPNQLVSPYKYQNANETSGILNQFMLR